MFHFPRVDVFTMEQELEVVRHANEEGRLDKPARADVSLDDHQHTIISTIDERLHDARQQGDEELNRLTIKFGGTDLGSIAGAVGNLSVDTEMQIERTKGNIHDRLMSLRHHERGMIRESNFFRRDNNIHRVADYPDSDILHWAIVGALILSESMADSFFLLVAAIWASWEGRSRQC
jgi:hypothetical protein